MPSLPEFIEFLVAKRVGATKEPYRCPWCGNERHVTNIASENIPAELRLHPTLVETSMPGFHGFYTISCTNCGHTAFFHRRQLDQWLAEKNPPVKT